jgi:hypothetical protein
MRHYLILAITLVSFQHVLGQNIDYETQIQPIFDNSCMPCHQGSNPSAGLDLSSYENVMDGSNSGPVISVGDYQNSVLWQEVSSGDMPNNIANNNMGIPDLTDNEIELIENWILDLECAMILCEPGYQCVFGECVCINDSDGDGICDEDDITLEEINNNYKVVHQFNLLGKDNSSNLNKNIIINVYDNGTVKKVKNVK